MKYFPTIIKTIFKYKDKTLFMDSMDYLPRCGGTYIHKGSFKAICKSSNFDEEIIFHEKTILIPGFYKPHGSKKFLELNDDHFLTSCEVGWKLQSQENNCILFCCFYPILNKPVSELVDQTLVPGFGNKQWSRSIYRISSDITLTISDVYQIQSEEKIFFPKDYYLTVISGKVVVNGIEKQKKSWTISSEDQIINVSNQSINESIIMILK